MGGLRRLQIYLDNTVYFVGQTVSGHIEVELDSPKKLRGILVKIKGEANVEWSETESYTDSNNQSSSRTVYYTAKEKYFTAEHYVIGGPGSEMTLPAGVYAYKFSAMIPNNVPSSFEGEYGHVRYSVKAVMDRPWRFNHESKGVFTVIQPLDLNFEPTVKEPVRRGDDKYLCCLCCATGPIQLDVSIPASGFAPGQTIPMSVSVDNATKEHLLVSANLYQTIKFHSTSRNRTEEYKICQSHVGSVTNRHSGYWNHGLQVPSIPPSFLRGCKIIDISYNVQVKVHIEGPHKNLTVRLPITIGTIPLMSPIAYEPPRNYGSTDVIIPTAPLDSPPGYSELDPPTYEECMQGRRNVKDKDDNEYVAGDKEFAPRYPMYRFNS